MEIYTAGFEVVLKADFSPVTLADKEADQIIREALEDTNIPVLSEEGDMIPFEERKKFPYLWIVDPLDGTKEFVARNGDFTVNIALVKDGKPILGVVTAPVKDELFYGIPGEGAWKWSGFMSADMDGFSFAPSNGERLVALPAAPAGEIKSFVGTKSHKTEPLHEMFEYLNQYYPNCNIWDIGSSLKFCMVAEGKADAYPRYNSINEWDTAAGQAVIEGSGGKVLELATGKPVRYNKPNLRQPRFIAVSAHFELPPGFFEFSARIV